MQIEPKQLTETSPHRFVTEASDLSIPAGEVPRTLEVPIGNGQEFELTAAMPEAFTYRQKFGCIEIVIFND